MFASGTTSADRNTDTKFDCRGLYEQLFKSYFAEYGSLPRTLNTFTRDTFPTCIQVQPMTSSESIDMLQVMRAMEGCVCGSVYGD